MELPTTPRVGPVSGASVGRSDRTGPTSSGSFEWKIAAIRVVAPVIGSTKTMSALSRPRWGCASGVFETLIVTAGWLRSVSVGTPVSGARPSMRTAPSAGGVVGAVGGAGVAGRSGEPVSAQYPSPPTTASTSTTATTTSARRRRRPADAIGREERPSTGNRDGGTRLDLAMTQGSAMVPAAGTGERPLLADYRPVGAAPSRPHPPAAASRPHPPARLAVQVDHDGGMVGRRAALARLPVDIRRAHSLRQRRVRVHQVDAHPHVLVEHSGPVV